MNLRSVNILWLLLNTFDYTLPFFDPESPLLISDVASRRLMLRAAWLQKRDRGALISCISFADEPRGSF